MFGIQQGRQQPKVPNWVCMYNDSPGVEQPMPITKNDVFMFRLKHAGTPNTWGLGLGLRSVTMMGAHPARRPTVPCCRTENTKAFVGHHGDCSFSSTVNSRPYKCASNQGGAG